MEENNGAIKEKSKISGNYLTGIIGAIIGGLIAAIPWIFVYIECNMILMQTILNSIKFEIKI